MSRARMHKILGEYLLLRRAVEGGAFSEVATFDEFERSARQFAGEEIAHFSIQGAWLLLRELRGA